MSNKMLKLAIIDDGVNINRFNIGDLEYNVEITEDIEIKEIVYNDSFKPSHGTTCAAIIKKIAPNVNLSSIKIMNYDTQKSTIHQLVSSIKWCVDNKINIVNMSLGTIDYRDFNLLRKVVNDAAKNGVIIVAAGNNDVGYTCPASLSNVIGVKCDINTSISLKEFEYSYDLYPCDGIEITAHSLDELVNYKGDVNKVLKCNSFTAPFIAATVYNIMYKQIDLTIMDIKRQLVRRSVNYNINVNNYFYSKNIDWLDTAIMFNLNGNYENISLSNYNIIEKINLRGSNIKNKLKDIVNYINCNITKLQNVDTIIISIEDYNITIIEKEILNFIDYLDSCRKNLVFIDDSKNELNLDKINKQINIKIWHTSLYKNINYKILNNKKNPLIIIYDFANNLSEIAAIKLKELFQSDGYYCIAGTNKSKNIIYELEYVPTNKIGLITNNIYNEDIYIYCVHGLKYKDEIDLEPDIRIIIEDENNSHENNFDMKSKLNTIVIKENTELNSIHVINKLYSNILELFKEQ